MVSLSSLQTWSFGMNLFRNGIFQFTKNISHINIFGNSFKINNKEINTDLIAILYKGSSILNIQVWYDEWCCNVL